MYTKFKKISCSLQNNIEKSRRDGKYEKRKFENMVGRSYYTLINCFSSHECLWNVTNGDYQDQNKTSLALEKVHVSMQEYDMNRYDYQVD